MDEWKVVYKIEREEQEDGTWKAWVPDTEYQAVGKTELEAVQAVARQIVRDEQGS